jgi:hypothetical protein
MELSPAALIAIDVLLFGTVLIFAAVCVVALVWEIWRGQK